MKPERTRRMPPPMRHRSKQPRGLAVSGPQGHLSLSSTPGKPLSESDRRLIAAITGRHMQS